MAEPIKAIWQRLNAKYGFEQDQSVPAILMEISKIEDELAGIFQLETELSDTMIAQCRSLVNQLEAIEL